MNEFVKTVIKIVLIHKSVVGS